MPDWDDSRDSHWRDLLVGLLWLVLGLAVLGIMAAVPIYLWVKASTH